MKILSMKNRIMLRVFALYTIRRFKVPFVAELSVFTIALILLFGLVSVPSIISNMSESGSFYRYLLAAFSNTTLMVQGLVLVVGSTLAFSVFTSLTALSKRFNLAIHTL